MRNKIIVLVIGLLFMAVPSFSLHPFHPGHPVSMGARHQVVNGHHHHHSEACDSVSQQGCTAEGKACNLPMWVYYLQLVTYGILFFTSMVLLGYLVHDRYEEHKRKRRVKCRLKKWKS